MLGVMAPGGIPEPPGDQPGLGVLPNGLQHAVTHLLRRRVGQHQRAVDQRRQAVQHVPPGHQGLSRLEVEPSREHRQLLEQRPLGGLEQLVAPIQRRLHRLLPRAGVADMTAQQRGFQPIEDLGRRQDAAPGRGQLDGQGQAVQAPTDLLDDPSS
jgi:hypothetical protein